MADKPEKEEKSEKAEKPAQDAFTSVMERLVAEMVKPAVEPTVRSSVVESVGKKMISYGYQMSEWSVKVLMDYLKGYNLWLCGKPGVGKTFFFDVMSKVRRSMGYESILKLSMIETQGWTMENARDWADETRDYNVLIDDVGTEPLEMVSYGQRVDLFPYLLEKRMQLTQMRTHLTSNLGAEDIMKRYGLRVSDRFVQMFKNHEYPDVVGRKKTTSRRHLTPWRIGKDGGGVI